MDMKDGRGCFLRFSSHFFDLLVGSVQVVQVFSGECRFDQRWFVMMEPCQRMHRRHGGGGRGERSGQEQGRAPVWTPHKPEQSEVSFAWGDMFYDEIPVDIIRMIVEMEGLIRMVAFEHGAKVVVILF